MSELGLRRKVGVGLLSIALLLAVALLFAQDQTTLRLSSAYHTSDPPFVDYLAALVGTTRLRGDRVEVLENGDETYPAMLSAIDRARQRVIFETYIYSPGAVADRFTAALTGAARRGVKVLVLVDAMGASDMDDGVREALERAGCELGVFNPVQPWLIEEVNYRTHRKILVVDGEVAFTGGIGIDDQWTGRAHDEKHWRDTQFKIEGPSVRMLEAAFYENWSESRYDAVRPELDPAPPGSGDSESVVIWSSPSGGSNALKRLYLLSIAAAARTLDVTSPYFVLDGSTRWSLADARRRGVRIRLLVEGDITDAKPVKFASRHDYESLLAQGIEIHEYQPTMMHSKALVADGVWSLFGSANFDNRSLELNDELNVAVRDPVLGARLVRMFEADLRRARRLTLETWRNRPLDDKAREKLWSLFAEVF